MTVTTTTSSGSSNFDKVFLKKLVDSVTNSEVVKDNNVVNVKQIDAENNLIVDTLPSIKFEERDGIELCLERYSGSVSYLRTNYN